MRSPMLDELTELDPAHHLHAPGRSDDLALRAILTADRAAPAARRSPRRAVVASAAAAALVAVAVGVTVAAPWGAAPAYATWSPNPTSVPDDVVAARTARCDSVAHQVSGQGPDARVVEVPTEPVLTETRGEYTYALLVGDGALGECLVTAPASGTTDVVGADTVLDQDGAAREAELPGRYEVTTLSSGTAAWSTGSTGEGALSSAYGRAGDGVAGVELTLASGEHVEATVQGGWWAVWAPGGTSLGDTAELTFTDGTTATAEVASSAAHG